MYKENLKVLALASYPTEAAATRYRLEQFISPLAERNITLRVSPFLNSRLFNSLYRRSQLPQTALGIAWSILKRLVEPFKARAVDVLLIQREAMILGPPLIEWLAMTLGNCPIVLDLDDATYIPYTSPTFGRFGSALKWFSKTDDLIRWAKVVTCGNRTIANYVESQGTRTVIIPTVVDTVRFKPIRHLTENEPPVLGWIGTHSTYPYLKMILPPLAELARNFPFRLKVIGAGDNIELPGVQVENLRWSLEREIADFQSFDIGLYPIRSDLYADQWAAGKSGFKAIQYMAVGIPYVVSPVAACAEIGERGVTHFCATTPDEWYSALAFLLTDRAQRELMGSAGRRHVLEHYTMEAQADKLAKALREAAAEGEEKGVIN